MTLLDYIRSVPDRRLVFPWMGSISLLLMEHTVAQVYASPDLQLALARTVDARFPTDFIYTLDHGAIFRDAWDVPLLRPDFDFPSTLEEIVTDRAGLARLRTLDPLSEPIMRRDLDSLANVKSAYEKPLYLSLEGPFTLAGELIGVTRLMRAVIRDPGFVQAVLDVTVATVAAYANAAARAGVDFFIVCEPTAVNLSAAQFERFVLPGYRTVFDGYSAWKALHICGDTNHLLGLLPECGAECLSLEAEVDFPALAGRLPAGMSLMGNTDPLALMRATPDQARDLALDLLRQMRDIEGFIPSPGCDFAPGTSLETVGAFLAALGTPHSEL